MNLARLRESLKHWRRQRRRAPRMIRKRKRQVQAKLRARSDRKWGGSRYYTNRIVDLVDGRARVTSRKRWADFGNPGSDHHRSQKLADAVDFGIVDAHWLKNEISRKLGGPSQLPDYATFTTSHGGHSYRHQAIAGTHGTGPHLHWGVRRIG